MVSIKKILSIAAKVFLELGWEAQEMSLIDRSFANVCEMI